MRDTMQRGLRDLRISVTDRCNFRCTYCMPKGLFGPDFAFLPRPQWLTFEEILRVTRQLVQLGVRKVRITGGEPLLRPEIERLIAKIAEIPSVEDIALTTNGSLLTLERAMALKAAGLQRVTVSLDALDDDVFMSMNDVRFPAARVLRAIDDTQRAGFPPVKLNAVIQRGVNEQSIVDLAAHFRSTGHIVRFIEYMDVGTSNGWQMDHVVPAHEMLRRIHERWPLEAVASTRAGEVARRYRYADGQGEIGVIASVTQPFCGGCTRERLSSDGQLFTCLFGDHGFDVRHLLREGASDAQLFAALADVWARRDDRYSEVRSDSTSGRSKVEMSRIGG